MSFFDEVDEPRTPPRTPPRRRPPSGTGRRPPGNQQSIQARRAVAAAVLVIVIILVALGVHSCQVSAANSALKDYSNNVASLIQQSGQTGRQLFRELASGGGAGNATNLQTQINRTRGDAVAQLSRAHTIDVPGEVRGAQVNLLLALQMRVDGITSIGTAIQPALGTATNKDAINTIAGDMARFYASDVLYKQYTATLIAGALHAAGIPVGPPNGQIIAGDQLLPSVQWLDPSFVASELNVSLAGSGTAGRPSPGLHGHSLDSVSVAGTTLQTGSTNTIPATPAPSFTLNFTNGGNSDERNVVCKVSVTGTSSSGQTTVPVTTAGQHGSCHVTLTTAPPAATETVVATIEPVAGEKNRGNNSLSFPVTFQ